MAQNGISIRNYANASGGVFYNGGVPYDATGAILVNGIGPGVTADLSTAYSSTVNATNLQAAITAIYAAGGGTVYLPAGTFSITENTVLLKSGVSIFGASPSTLMNLSSLDVPSGGTWLQGQNGSGWILGFNPTDDQAWPGNTAYFPAGLRNDGVTSYCNPSLAGVCVDGIGFYQCGIGIKIGSVNCTGANWLSIRNISAQTINGDLIAVYNSFNWRVQHVRAWNVSGTAVRAIAAVPLATTSPGQGHYEDIQVQTNSVYGTAYVCEAIKCGTYSGGVFTDTTATINQVHGFNLSAFAFNRQSGSPQTATGWTNGNANITVTNGAALPVGTKLQVGAGTPASGETVGTVFNANFRYGQVYFVVSQASNVIQLSATRGGAAINSGVVTDSSVTVLPFITPAASTSTASSGWTNGSALITPDTTNISTLQVGLPIVFFPSTGSPAMGATFNATFVYGRVYIVLTNDGTNITVGNSIYGSAITCGVTTDTSAVIMSLGAPHYRASAPAAGGVNNCSINQADFEQGNTTAVYEENTLSTRQFLQAVPLYVYALITARGCTGGWTQAMNQTFWMAPAYDLDSTSVASWRFDGRTQVLAANSVYDLNYNGGASNFYPAGQVYDGTRWTQRLGSGVDLRVQNAGGGQYLFPQKAIGTRIASSNSTGTFGSPTAQSENGAGMRTYNGSAQGWWSLPTIVANSGTTQQTSNLGAEWKYVATNSGSLAISTDGTQVFEGIASLTRFTLLAKSSVKVTASQAATAVSGDATGLYWAVSDITSAGYASGALAAGSTQATGGPMVNAVNKVTNANNTLAVTLLDVTNAAQLLPGQSITIINDSAFVLPVFPTIGGNFYVPGTGASGANAVLNMAARTTYIFIQSSALEWIAMKSA